MKTYQYQILRYTHDHITGEFMNVGLVLHEPESAFLRAYVIPNTKRLADFFPASQLLTELRYFAETLNTSGEQLASSRGPAEKPRLVDFTILLLPPNDAALQLTEPTAGLSEDPAATFATMCRRLICS